MEKPRPAPSPPGWGSFPHSGGKPAISADIIALFPFSLSLQRHGSGQMSGQGQQDVDVPPCSPPSPSSAAVKLQRRVRAALMGRFTTGKSGKKWKNTDQTWSAAATCCLMRTGVERVKEATFTYFGTAVLRSRSPAAGEDQTAENFMKLGVHSGSRPVTVTA
ncbi:hypothetical protein AOLI_G00092270 [Acnodon oligacanthus]